MCLHTVLRQPLLGLLSCLALAAPATEPPQPASMPVITLDPRPLPAPDRGLGWRCDSLLRTDWSLQRGRCEDKSPEPGTTDVSSAAAARTTRLNPIRK